MTDQLKRKLKAKSRRQLKIRSVQVGRRERIVVNRTSKHIYAQIISKDGAQTLATIGTNQPALREVLKSTSNIEAAKLVGKLVGEKALELNLKQVSFDRGGNAYHGRVKALAEAARETGIII